MTKFYLLTLCILSLLTCSCGNSDLHYLTSGKSKFWDSRSNRGYCYEFRKDGICRYYYYHKGKLPRNLFPFDDVIVPEEWHFLGKDSIMIQGFKYNYKFLSPDSLVIVNAKRPGDIDTLIKSVYQ